MKKRIFFWLRKWYISLVNIGLNPILFIDSLRGLPFFLKDLFVLLIRYKIPKGFKFTLSPIFSEKFSSNGNVKNQYFIQDLYIASLIFKNNPALHVDFGSRVDGFVAHVASFRTIEVFDFRPQAEKISNIIFKKADIMKIEEQYVNYCDSVSSLHVFDNIGLGRYGDPINPCGHLIAFDNMHKILKQGGLFYFTTPMGMPQRIEFNANIVYSLNYLLDMIKNKFEIVSFSYIDDGMNLHEQATITDNDIKTTFNCCYGLAIFVLKKI